MRRHLGIAGLDPEELSTIRLLLSLLRHPDASVAELARQALYYVRDTSGDGAVEEPRTRNSAS
jgi:hypothetical protein